MKWPNLKNLILNKDWQKSINVIRLCETHIVRVRYATRQHLFRSFFFKNIISSVNQNMFDWGEKRPELVAQKELKAQNTENSKRGFT